MADDSPDTAATRFDWERVIRRARLGAPTKAVALAMATYANQDGSRVYPGVARLSAVTELSERSVRGALAKLRSLGLIDRTIVGGHRGLRAYTDEHRLTIPADLFDVVEMLDPTELPSSQPAGGAAWDQSQPAPGAAQPAGGAAQPAGGAAQPAPDDIPTGTWCTPPVLTPHVPDQLPTDDSSFGTQVQNAHEMSTEEIRIYLEQVDELAARRRGA